MTRALLVHPEFRSASFWNYRETCQLMDARYPAAPLGLCTVAGLLPQDWEFRLVDRNVETLEARDLEWADMVFTGGMMPQQLDALEVIRLAREHGKPVVVGGPDPTSSPHIYEQANHRVLGEGEVTIPMFLRDLNQGKAQAIYRDDAKANVQESPTPRFDLLKFDRYNHIGVQWCRGCPFNCEFCDIIELYGRVPRAKSSEQMLRELQTLYDLGYRGHVDLVDDNFIGNKKLVKQFLPDLKTWLAERDWPFEFTTEASINLADDDKLMELMQEVGFMAIFVGIESPDEDTLRQMQKRQNTRRSIAESVEKIYRHGMFVNAGFIIGFDSERGGVARGVIQCIEDTSIPVAMVGLLYALPNTQLTRRLASEGRLHPHFDVQQSGVGDQCTAGINYDPYRPRLDILKDYLTVVETAYRPDYYFGRVRRVVRQLDSSKRHFVPPFRRRLLEIKGLMRLIGKIGLRGPARGEFWRTFLSALVFKPGSLRPAGAMMGLYAHFGPFSRYVADRIRLAIAEEERRPSKMAVAPPPKPAPVEASATIA
jgi:radical SAM superfamily enzyme YgiQ (UPF0313 family)